VISRGYWAAAIPDTMPQNRDSLLAAIGRAKCWVDELVAGASLVAIAKREGKGERQIRLLIPLAFVAPQTVKAIAAADTPPITITNLAKSVPLVWSGIMAQTPEAPGSAHPHISSHD